MSGTGVEQCGALRDVQDIINERGMSVRIELLGEDDVVRDKFGSIKKRDSSGAIVLTTKAFPITFSPTDKQKNEAGIREKTTVIVWTAMKAWTDAGIDPNILLSVDSIRTKVTIQGIDYEISDKNMVDQFIDTFLYVTLGLNRK